MCRMRVLGSGLDLAPLLVLLFCDDAVSEMFRLIRKGLDGRWEAQDVICSSVCRNARGLGYKKSLKKRNQTR